MIGDSPSPGVSMSMEWRMRKTPFFLFLLFLGLFLAGVMLDEPMRVLEQARSICLECIGIG